ncbi:MAG TPA: EutN/CcmL family microcompartment protein [Nitrospinota bacterium]|jgi:microcompartment protein CcmK/EutM|nr:EutN/CcmL family microcompartment protein [Nitrospinota bacterium]
MLLGKVIGTVVSTQKEEQLKGFKFYIVEQVDANNHLTGDTIVAVDSVGSGIGEIVLYATGSSARQTKITENKPVDAVIVAIVDTWEVEGEVKYKKD